MKATLVYRPADNSISRVSWTRSGGVPRHEDDVGVLLPYQKRIVDCRAIVDALALDYGEFGHAVKSACVLSEDGSSLVRKSTDEVLSQLEDLE